MSTVVFILIKYHVNQLQDLKFKEQLLIGQKAKYAAHQSVDFNPNTNEHPLAVSLTTKIRWHGI